MVESSENPHYLCLQHNICLNLLLFKAIFLLDVSTNIFYHSKVLNSMSFTVKVIYGIYDHRTPGGPQEQVIGQRGLLVFSKFPMPVEVEDKSKGTVQPKILNSVIIC